MSAFFTNIKESWLAVLFVLAFLDTNVSFAAIPEPLPGWSMELVLEAPRLRHPSVVTCAPDGRVFIAEDPMDISLPNANAAEGRILCLHTNGQVTIFAEKLYAVFGLQYLEGKLYVLHNPKFSVFDDDNGVGQNRRELIEQTLPEPSALNWNDHVPANFRLAMDGYFYIACGDKGLFNATGTDGSSATLSSGGVFRLRPDGSELEVFSHGVRNILDVALNAEDEIFTYDNTDEHDWMGRFTHMVEAGFYGYPHDFIPRRPYTLWMMEDYGAGAACGAFAYNEDALPPEYHGNIFMADFGKRQVMRVRVERNGGTYRAVEKQELFSNPPGDFRPVGITLGPDGKSIYICDWQHRDEKAQVNVGRLWKLTWTGEDHGAPKPKWYLPAATGQAENIAVQDLIEGLSHGSHSVRMAAQRALTRLPQNDRAPALKELTRVLNDSRAPDLARVHALWALHAIDGGQSARSEVMKLCTNQSAILRRQAIRQLAARRVADAVPSLLERLRDNDASVRFHAATALGRIGDDHAAHDLTQALDETDLFARFAIFTALKRIGTNTPSAWKQIVRGLESANERIREGTTFALRETYKPALVNALVEFFRDRSRTLLARKTALELLAAVHHRKSEWKGEWWAYHPALQPPPPKTQRWAGTEMVLTTLREGLRAPETELRRISIEGLAAARDTHSAAALRDIFAGENDPSARATILGALGAMKDRDAMPLVMAELKKASSEEVTMSAIHAAGELGGEKAIKALEAFMQSREREPRLLARAIATLAKLNAKPDAIRTMTSNSVTVVRAAAVEALGKLETTNSLPLLSKAVADPSLEVRRAALKALDNLKSSHAIPALLQAHADDPLRSDAFSALARQPDPRALEILLDALASKNPAQRNAAHLAIRAISPSVREKIETIAGTLPPQALTELRQIYAGNAKAESGPIFAKAIRQLTTGEYLAAAISLKGDAERGRQLFADPMGVNCIACHRVGGAGIDTGPDLSNIGAQFDRRALAESILFPSKAVREGYQQMTVETSDGEVLSGIVRSENTTTLTVRDSGGRERQIPRAAITARRNSALSLMPEGLHSALSLQEFADLIEYVTTLKAP